MTGAADADLRPDALDQVTTDLRGVCRILTCSESHARRLVRDGLLPGVIRQGKLLRFHVPTLLDHVRQLATGDPAGVYAGKAVAGGR